MTYNNNDLYYYNLNILVMALHEHTISYQPTSTSIRLVFLSHPIPL